MTQPDIDASRRKRALMAARRLGDEDAPATTKTAPKLAIIISCFNYEAYIEQAIQSVMAQGRQDCELVVVDDCSTDNSWEIIQRTGVTAYRIANSGQLAACVYGLDRTSAPFVLFLDADDELIPNSLRVIIAKLDAGVAKLQFPLIRIDHTGRVIGGAVPSIGVFRHSHDLAERVLRTGVYATPPTSGNVFRRDLCEFLREVDYDRAVDGVILFAAPFLGDVVSLSTPLGLYRIHDRNDSGQGRPIDPVSLKRDLRRFVDRMAHLRRILTSYGLDKDLIRAENSYFYLERTFYLTIADGRRTSFSNVSALLRMLWQDYYPLRSKMTITAFLVLASALSNHRARRCLAYRLDSGSRSTIGLIKAVL
jgi:glycosyltransferase involved in cell wall biosynthesis